MSAPIGQHQTSVQNFFVNPSKLAESHSLPVRLFIRSCSFVGNVSTLGLVRYFINRTHTHSQEPTHQVSVHTLAQKEESPVLMTFTPQQNWNFFTRVLDCGASGDGLSVVDLVEHYTSKRSLFHTEFPKNKDLSSQENRDSLSNILFLLLTRDGREIPLKGQITLTPARFKRAQQKMLQVLNHEEFPIEERGAVQSFLKKMIPSEKRALLSNDWQQFLSE